MRSVVWRKKGHCYSRAFFLKRKTRRLKNEGGTLCNFKDPIKWHYLQVACKHWLWSPLIVEWSAAAVIAGWYLFLSFRRRCVTLTFDPATGTVSSARAASLRECIHVCSRQVVFLVSSSSGGGTQHERSRSGLSTGSTCPGRGRFQTHLRHTAQRFFLQP